MMSFSVTARLLDNHLSTVTNGTSDIALGTDMQGNDDALNPMELLMAALSACMLKGINRVTPLLGLTIEAVTITVEADRQDSPPLVSSMRYRIVVESPDSDEKLQLLHDNLLKFGTITNTIAAGTTLRGELVRA
jgi:uncharacterized OsmC-like protein